MHVMNICVRKRYPFQTISAAGNIKTVTTSTFRSKGTLYFRSPSVGTNQDKTHVLGHIIVFIFPHCNTILLFLSVFRAIPFT